MENSNKKELDDRIIEFILDHHVLTLSTCVDNKPYISHCFYVFDKEEVSLIFTSDLHTKHAQQSITNCEVAAGIALETTMVGQIRGLQITGTIQLLEGKDEKSASKLYIKKFPFALLSTTCMWKLTIHYLKFTDNRLGFGKKIAWQKSPLN